MSQILVELIKLANLVINITKALACAGRIQSIFDVKPSMQDGIGHVKETKDDVPVVEFKNVSLTYSGAGDTSIADTSFKAYRDRLSVLSVVQVQVSQVLSDLFQDFMM